MLEQSFFLASLFTTLESLASLTLIQGLHQDQKATCDLEVAYLWLGGASRGLHPNPARITTGHWPYAQINMQEDKGVHRDPLRTA